MDDRLFHAAEHLNFPLEVAVTVKETFCDQLKVLMDKHDHGVEDVAQLANTGTFVVREWLSGRAVPVARIRTDVLNALDDPTQRRNYARGFLGIPEPWF